MKIYFSIRCCCIHNASMMSRPRHRRALLHNEKPKNILKWAAELRWWRESNKNYFFLIWTSCFSWSSLCPFADVNDVCLITLESLKSHWNLWFLPFHIDDDVSRVNSHHSSSRVRNRCVVKSLSQLFELDNPLWRYEVNPTREKETWVVEKKWKKMC